MKLHYCLIAFLLAVAGCAHRHDHALKSRPGVPAVSTLQGTNSAAEQRTPDEALNTDPAWLAVKTAVMREVARQEGTHSALAAAYCTPCLRQNGVWAVIVHLARDDWRSAEHINILVSDRGQVAAYTRVAGKGQ